MSKARRHVAVITSSRADYSHLHWVLREMQGSPRIMLSLIVCGSHLSDTFGETIREIEADGFEVTARVPCLASGDDDVAMARTVGDAVLGLAEVLGELRPDLLLLIADRYEMLAPAAVATTLRIPIAHIEGGEVSQGAIDDPVRNALTKLSHLHFTPTPLARRRVLRMGEESWRVRCTGAPSLDHLTRSELPAGEALAEALGFTPTEQHVVVAVHSLTLARDTLREADATFAALRRLVEQAVCQLVFCFPNADAGGQALITRAGALQAEYGAPRVHLRVNLNPRVYWAMLARVGCLLGNSSSGIMEAPALGLPAVNVGERQAGRERARNIIDVPAEAERIVGAVQEALSDRFRASLVGMENPYGDGQAAVRIVRALEDVPLGEALLRKSPVPPIDLEES
ncbi:MAG: UDP-N-acetylglucosamine 2-epimerase [Pseudomonadota bacterium]